MTTIYHVDGADGAGKTYWTRHWANEDDCRLSFPTDPDVGDYLADMKEHLPNTPPPSDRLLLDRSCLSTAIYGGASVQDVFVRMLSYYRDTYGDGVKVHQIILTAPPRVMAKRLNGEDRIAQLDVTRRTELLAQLQRAFLDTVPLLTEIVDDVYIFRSDQDLCLEDQDGPWNA